MSMTTVDFHNLAAVIGALEKEGNSKERVLYVLCMVLRRKYGRFDEVKFKTEVERFEKVVVGGNGRMKVVAGKGSTES